MSTSDMLTHPWILTESEGTTSNTGGNKKKLTS